VEKKYWYCILCDEEREGFECPSVIVGASFSALEWIDHDPKVRPR
jgi:hypothetical protein